MGSNSVCELLGDKTKRPLHLCDTSGLHSVHGFESVLVGLGGGDLNDVIYNFVEGHCLFNNA